MSNGEQGADFSKDKDYLEWLRCQEAITSFDQMMLDIRKYGFSFITLLLGANGYLQSDNNLGPGKVLSIYFALLILIVGLFRLDRVHQVFLRGAVLRAMQIEKKAKLGFGLSTTISEWSMKLRTATWGHWLYAMFCAAAAGIALAGVVAKPKPDEQLTFEVLRRLVFCDTSEVFVFPIIIGLFAAVLYILHYHCHTIELRKAFRDLLGSEEENPWEALFCWLSGLPAYGWKRFWNWVYRVLSRGDAKTQSGKR